MRYLVTALVNAEPGMRGMRDGYEPSHKLATVGYFDIETPHDDFNEAAEAMFAIGNREGTDLNGQEWPSDVRSLSVGDLLFVSRNSDSVYAVLSVESSGWQARKLPADSRYVPLAGTEATSRKAE